MPLKRFVLPIKIQENSLKVKNNRNFLGGFNKKP